MHLPHPVVTLSTLNGVNSVYSLHAYQVELVGFLAFTGLATLKELRPYEDKLFKHLRDVFFIENSFIFSRESTKIGVYFYTFLLTWSLWLLLALVFIEFLFATHLNNDRSALLTINNLN